jgi:heme/copper-type cytochrome/quinol oxidase subunit 2
VNARKQRQSEGFGFRVKSFTLIGASGAILVLIMLGGGLLLWVGVPVGWLYVGSQVQGETGSLGAALAVMMVGVLVSILVIVPVLAWLNHKHSQLRVARGLDDHGQMALEAVMTVSAGVALAGFGAWFLFFSGASPLPTGLGI